VTGRYDLQDQPGAVPVEFGPHPDLSARDPEPAIDASMAFTPGAVSFRAHSLHFSERLRPILRKHGIRFSSSAQMYLQPGVRTYEVGYGLTEVPVFWMDAFHLEYSELSGRPRFEVPREALMQPGLKVLAVHPVHLVLNTESRRHYRDSRHVYHDAPALRARRWNGRGIADLFTDMVRTLEELGYEFVLLREAAPS
jgi:Polysaccharide deacetylase